ncbi:hypothetical protein AB0F62_34700, partial [Streptomyces sp. NPDC026673]
MRSLTPGRIAALLLAMLRHDQRLLGYAGRNGVPEPHRKDFVASPAGTEGLHIAWNQSWKRSVGRQ